MSLNQTLKNSILQLKKVIKALESVSEPRGTDKFLMDEEPQDKAILDYIKVKRKTTLEEIKKRFRIKSVNDLKPIINNLKNDGKIEFDKGTLGTKGNLISKTKIIYKIQDAPKIKSNELNIAQKEISPKNYSFLEFIKNLQNIYYKNIGMRIFQFL